MHWVQHCKKETVEWNFSNLEISILLHLSKHYSTGFFRNFSVSSSVTNKMIFIQKNIRSRLKINAIDGKRSGLSLLLCTRTASATLI